ncbi:MAG: hypothetical protein BGO11_03340 [Solirubrobacterales bacterium 70-9]|nr:MAG: hypothetical protein BGO11_03340 [Solirubrobacterales bacterium 70-9]
MLFLLLLALGAALLAGCGGSSAKDERQPVACREGTGVYLEALRAAPGDVILAGETPISGCLVPTAEEGELVDLGEAALAAATKLNAAARAEPDGPAALQLGYLLGAIARGSAKTEGVHAELLRRLTVAARFAPAGEPLSQRFLAAYEKGFAAGRKHG